MNARNNSAIQNQVLDNNLDQGQLLQAKPIEACQAQESQINHLAEDVSKIDIDGKDTSNTQTANSTLGDPRSKLRSWLGRVFRIVITDGRVIVGRFVCTDRDGNVILENSWEYTQLGDGTLTETNEPRMLGLALVPGKHLISVALMT